MFDRATTPACALAPETIANTAIAKVLKSFILKLLPNNLMKKR
jgi:hypothetical protein